MWRVKWKWCISIETIRDAHNNHSYHRAYLSTDVWHLCVRICKKIGKIFTCFLFVLLGGLVLAYQSSPSCYLCFIIGLCLGIFAQKHMSILPIKSQYESIHFPQLQSEPHSMLSISSDGGLNWNSFTRHFLWCEIRRLNVGVCNVQIIYTLSVTYLQLP